MARLAVGARWLRARRWGAHCPSPCLRPPAFFSGGLRGNGKAVGRSPFAALSLAPLRPPPSAAPPSLWPTLAARRACPLRCGGLAPLLRPLRPALWLATHPSVSWFVFCLSKNKNKERKAAGGLRKDGQCLGKERPACPPCFIGSIQRRPSYAELSKRWQLWNF